MTDQQERRWTPRKVHEYDSDEIIVRYEPKRCIHAAECVRGLPGVFDPQKRRWIAPENASVEEIVDVVARCPSGALGAEPRDSGSKREPGGVVTSVTPVANGPVILQGHIRLTLPDGTQREESKVALCRCGASQNKPLCDGRHAAIGFEAE